MSSSQSVLLFFPRNFLIISLIVLLTTSCVTVVKNYPSRIPFVYQTNININGNFSNQERETLTSRLKGQLDDSMRSRTISKVVLNVMKKPPVYDSANADKSVVYMRALLSSLGYFRDSITYSAKVDTAKGDQYRTKITFNVTPGKVVHIDSFSYNLKQPELQKIAIDNEKDAFIKKGMPFAKANISAELDRLVELYRDKGYLRFGREALIGLWDTLDISLLKPTLDPFEQLEILQKLKERRENPVANLELRLRPGFDSSKLTKYFVGNITVMPDFSQDTVLYSQNRLETWSSGVKIVSYRDLFLPKIIPQNIFLKHGELYNQQNYFNTINRFNSMGSWRLVNIDQLPRRGQDTADFLIRLTPAKHFAFTTNIEGSLNNSVFSGNLLGIGINATLQNRNLWKRANIASTSIRFGVETGRDKATNIKFIQTRQISIGHVIYFPRPIPNSKWIPEKIRNSFRTSLSFNAALTERRELYNLKSINGSWGYEFQSGKKLFTLRLPNFEYSAFSSQPKLDTIFKYNPSLKNVFSDGFISSIMAGMTVSSIKKENVNSFRINIEESGLLTGFIRNKFLDTNLYRFIKIDAEFVKKIVVRKSALVMRFFAGIGYEFESTVNERRKDNLPFIRQYFAGGPNSMRAWALRKLGPGSLVKDFSITGLPDRYGDLQLEANIEYRYPMFKLFGIKIKGALFTDIGNIWWMKKADGRKDEEIFTFNKLGKDIAVGVGTGVRIDFDFFIIRLDYSIKAKDPSPADIIYQNKWFGYKKWSDMDQFQLGISLPFIL